LHGKFRAPTDHVPLAWWYNGIDQEQLLKDKCIYLIFYKKEQFTEYWKPFAPYLERLVSATWPDKNLFMPSSASHKVFKDILNEALGALKPLREVPAKYAAYIRQKCARVNIDEGRIPIQVLLRR
jgi:hypothetical protein